MAMNEVLNFLSSYYMDLVDDHDPRSSHKANLSATRRQEIEVKPGVEKPPVLEPEGIRDNPTAYERELQDQNWSDACFILGGWTAKNEAKKLSPLGRAFCPGIYIQPFNCRFHFLLTVDGVSRQIPGPQLPHLSSRTYMGVLVSFLAWDLLWWDMGQF